MSIRLLSGARKHLAVDLLPFAMACHAGAPTPPLQDTRAELDEMARETVAAAAAAAEDRRPAFSQATVLKFNPIMKQSKDALDQFDTILPDYRSAVESGDAEAVALLRRKIEIQLDWSILARTAFQAERAALEARGEYFDKLILETMETFVTDAPNEIAAALES